MVVGFGAVVVLACIAGYNWGFFAFVGSAVAGSEVVAWFGPPDVRVPVERILTWIGWLTLAGILVFVGSAIINGTSMYLTGSNSVIIAKLGGPPTREHIPEAVGLVMGLGVVLPLAFWKVRVARPILGGLLVAALAPIFIGFGIIVVAVFAGFGWGVPNFLHQQGPPPMSWEEEEAYAERRRLEKEADQRDTDEANAR